MYINTQLDIVPIWYLPVPPEAHDAPSDRCFIFFQFIEKSWRKIEEEEQILPATHHLIIRWISEILQTAFDHPEN